MLDLGRSRVLVTGAGGFLGRRIAALLADRAVREVLSVRRSDCDLTVEDSVKALFERARCDVVIHAAADIGGIGYSSAHPGQQFYHNTLMNVLTLHHAWASGARKFVGVGSVCEYPAETPVPFREDHLWNGYPVASNDAYGISKRVMLAQSIAYRKQYGFNAIHLLPINLYGPGDDFDLQSSHVIPALIRKCHAAIAAGQTEVSVWGDGSASREFLYVDDAARAVILAAEQYDDADPVNVGTGTEITIAELTREVAAVTGFRGRFAFDATKPAGQSRRLLDVSKARDLFGFTATTPLREGLEKTYEYFLRSVL